MVAVLRLANRRRIEWRRARSRRAEYQRWVLAHDTLTPQTLAALKGRLSGLPACPRIGLSMPAFGVQTTIVRAAIDAVLGQIYPHWTLSVVLGADGIAPLASALHSEPRIELVLARDARDAWQKSLTCAEGDWLGVIDPRDHLRPHALLLLAEAIGQASSAELVHADHDQIDAAGRRHTPALVCDWNPELLLAQPYLGPVVLMRAARMRSGAAQALLADAAGCRHELALCCSGGLAAHQVVHVPHMLAHAAAAPAASVAAAQRHLERLGLSASAQLDRLGGCCIRVDPPPARPLVSLIIPTRDRLDLLKRCIDSVLAQTEGVNFEMLIVDNGSVEAQTLQYFASLAGDGRVSVLRDDGPFNYSALNNAAVQAAQGEFVLLLNNDTEVINARWLAEMLGLAALPGVGAVGARLWFDDSTLQHAGLVLGLDGVAGYAHRRLSRGAPGIQSRAHLLQEVSAVTAACLLVRRSSYLAVGGLDEKHLAVAYNDVDFCLRLRQAGLRNLWTPNAELFHHESKSRGSDASASNQDRFLREFKAMRERWGPWLDLDPAYNPNLALVGGAFELAWPPRVSLTDRWFED